MTLPVTSPKPTGQSPSPRQEPGHTSDVHVPPPSTSDADDDDQYLPPLRPVTLPKVLPFHQPALAEHGWSTVTYDGPTDSLYLASEALLQASKAFFDLPTSSKEGFKTKGGSEEGWSRVEGEKEFITLRSINQTPPELRDAATTYWAQAGGLLNEQLGRIAESLGMPAQALTQYSDGPCRHLHLKKTATMLRLFRYEGFEAEVPKVVAEPHRDLGLLSLVFGDTPGLEVWNLHQETWFNIEQNYLEPASTLLAGKQLEILSNGRYPAGGHLVRSYPNDMAAPSQEALEVSSSKKYRYSIVFVLRAHSSVPVDTDTLTTSITGTFKNPLRGITAHDMFRAIYTSHYNVNTSVEERRKQHEKIIRKREMATAIQESGNEKDS